MGRRKTQTLRKNESAESGSLVMLSNAKHNGVFYKKGEHVTLDAETQVEFAKLGLIDSASGVAAQPSDDQTQDANDQEDGGANEGDTDQEDGLDNKSDNS